MHYSSSRFNNFWVSLAGYITQPIGDEAKPPILDPFEFDTLKKEQFLQRCWVKACPKLENRDERAKPDVEESKNTEL